MAVYKASYCYPFLNTLDPRVADNSDSSYGVQYLTCRVDTSNKQITGYKIRLLDSDNNQIFPLNNGEGKISPIEELSSTYMSDIILDGETNTGVNGTYLKIPFFQNDISQKLKSFNAIYYTPQIMADYLMCTENIAKTVRDLSDATVLAKWKASTENPPVYNQATTPAVINESKWVYDRTLDLLRYRTDNLTRAYSDSELSLSFDGECCVPGKYIAIINGTKTTNYTYYDGMWTVVTKDITYNDNGDTVTIYALKKLQNRKQIAAGNYVTILCGITYHNMVWENKETEYSRVTTTSSLYKCYATKSIQAAVPGLDCKGTSYKWEITLYQGNCQTDVEYAFDPPVPSGMPWSATYDKIDNEYLDISLTTGTILGSNSSRVQIASVEDEFKDMVLPEALVGTLVLQNKYMGLSNVSNKVFNIFNGTRVAVTTYDASFGHVYPETNSLDANVVNMCGYCQFFQHSNNPESILNSDIVDFGFNEEIKIYSNNASSISERRIYATENSTLGTLIDKFGIEEGASILIINAIDEISTTSGKSTVKQFYKNGVYRYKGRISSINVYNEDGSSRNTEKNVYNFARASSYENWAAYIGKVIYCSRGSLGGTNIESLANSGTYSLWNPLNSISGDSNLIFANEMPLLLFANKLKSNRTFRLLNKDQAFPSTYSGTGITIDSQDMSVGDLILYKDGNWGKVQTIVYDSGTQTYTYTLSTKDGEHSTDFTIVKTNDYVYISDGDNFGHRVFKWKSSTEVSQWDKNNANWDLYTAKILKNDAEHTYISPYSELKPLMKLKLSGQNEITYDDGTISQWINVEDCNTITYGIKHDAISATSYGVDSLTHGLSSFENNYDKTPWNYELRTYFRASNENPFNSYERPYILMYKNGDDSRSLGGYLDINNISFGDMIKFLDEKVEIVEVQERFIELKGLYIQHQGMNWEKYRWTLFDASLNKIQDTGNQYNKDMSVKFYGLNTDLVAGSMYYVILSVMDEIGFSLGFGIKIHVAGADPLSTQTMPVSLTATYDCNTNSVVLKYADIGRMAPSFASSNNNIEYNSNNALWDRSLQTTSANTNTLNYMNISGVDYNDNPVVYFNNEDYTSRLSNSVKYGVNYGAHFNRSDHINQITDANNSHLANKDDGFYCQTKVRLDDNFCGEFLNIDIQSSHCIDKDSVTGVDVPPVVDEQGRQHLSGYVTIALALPYNITLDTKKDIISRINLLRFFVQSNIYTDRDVFSSPDLISYFGGVEEDTYNWGKDVYGTASEIKEYLHWKYGTMDPKADQEFLNLYPNFYICNKNEHYLNSDNSFLGNCNYINDEVNDQQKSLFNTMSFSKNAPSHWAENRDKLRLPTSLEQSYFLKEAPYEPLWNMIDTKLAIDQKQYINDYTGQEGSPKHWNFWNEDSTVTGAPQTSIFWDNIEAPINENTNSKIKTVMPFKKHKGALSNKWFVVECKIPFIDDFYTLVKAGQCQVDYVNDLSNKKYTIIYKSISYNANDEVELCRITLKEVKE